MSDYRRLISYIYVYEGGVKGKILDMPRWRYEGDSAEYR